MAASFKDRKGQFAVTWPHPLDECNYDLHGPVNATARKDNVLSQLSRDKRGPLARLPENLGSLYMEIRHNQQLLNKLSFPCQKMKCLKTFEWECKDGRG